MIAGNAGFEGSVVVEKVKTLPAGRGPERRHRRVRRPAQDGRHRPGQGHPLGAAERRVDRRAHPHHRGRRQRRSRRRTTAVPPRMARHGRHGRDDVASWLPSSHAPRITHTGGPRHRAGALFVRLDAAVLRSRPARSASRRPRPVARALCLDLVGAARPRRSRPDSRSCERRVGAIRRASPPPAPRGPRRRAARERRR